MDCAKCGAENPEDGTFCQKCGESLAEAATAKTKAKAKPKAKARPKAKAVDSSDEGGSDMPDLFKNLPIMSMLLWGAVATLGLGVLYGIVAAIGYGDTFDDGAVGFAEFLKGVIFGVVGAGVLLGIYRLNTKV